MASAIEAGWKKAAIYDPATGLTMQLDRLALELSGCLQENLMMDSADTRLYGGQRHELTLAFFEEGIRNLLTYTRDFSTNWNLSTGGVASLPVRTLNYGVAPDGTTTATRLQFALNGGVTTADISAIAQNFAGMTTGTVYNASLWIKTTDGSTKTLALGIPDGFAGNIVATGTWQRLSAVRTSVSTGTGAYNLRLRGAEGTSDSADVLVWGGQATVGSQLEEYFPVTGGTYISIASQLRTWEQDRTPLRAVVAGDVNNLQWYESEPIEFFRMPKADKRSGLNVYVVKMQNISVNPAIYQNQNLLAYLGWEDTNANNLADNYVASGGATATSFSSLIQTMGAIQDYRSLRTPISASTIQFPISGITLTASFDVTTVHTVLTYHNHKLASVNSALSEVNSSIGASTTTGVKSRTITTQVGAFGIVYEPIQGNGVATAGTVAGRCPAITTNGELTPGTSFMSW